MNLVFDFRAGPLPEALERQNARINVIWGKEHDPETGAHRDITANSLKVTGDITAGGTITGGSLEVTGGIAADHLNLKGPRPYIQFTETDQAIDAQAWQIAANGTQFHVQTSSVDGLTRTDALLFNRSGLTPTSIQSMVPIGVMTAPAVNTSSVLLVNGILTAVAGGGFSINIAFGSGAWRYIGNGYGWLAVVDAGGGLQWYWAANNGSGANAPAAISASILMTQGGGLVVTGRLDARGTLMAWADGSAVAIRMVGRSDNFGGIQWLGNDGATLFWSMFSNGPGYLEFRSAVGVSYVMTEAIGLYPVQPDTKLFGTVNNYWLQMYGLWHDSRLGYGFIFNSNVQLGMVYNSTTGWLDLRGGNTSFPAMRWSNITCWFPGTVQIDGQLQVPVGAAAAPGIVFNGTTTGWWHAAGEIKISFAGVNKHSFAPQGQYITGWTEYTRQPPGTDPASCGPSPAADNNGYCGQPAKRWTIVYSVGGVNTGSDARFKNCEANPLGLEFIRQIETVRYFWKHDLETPHYGVTAQQLESLGFDAVVHPRNEREQYNLNYSELIAPIIRAIQELDQRVSDATSVTKW